MKFELSLTRFSMAAAAAVLAATLMGCEQEGPAEKTGEAVDEAVQDAGDSAENAADTAGDKMEEAGEELKKAAE